MYVQFNDFSVWRWEVNKKVLILRWVHNSEILIKGAPELFEYIMNSIRWLGNEKHNHSPFSLFVYYSVLFDNLIGRDIFQHIDRRGRRSSEKNASKQVSSEIFFKRIKRENLV